MAQTPAPPFIVFSVEDGIDSVGDYNRVIIGMRGRIPEECVTGRDASGVTTSRPMLTLDRSGDPDAHFRFLDIIFIRNRREGDGVWRRYDIRVRFLQDNLYVLGFQLNDRQWREFEWDVNRTTGRRPRYLPNSQYITDHDGSYTSRMLRHVTLGGQGLRSALDALIDQPNNDRIAAGLGTIAIMFSEAARFEPILQHILREFLVSPGVDEWLLTRAQRWARYSGWIRYYLAHPEEEWPLMTLRLSVVRNPGEAAVVTDVPIRTTIQLLKLMGILHNSPDYVRRRGPDDNY